MVKANNNIESVHQNLLQNKPLVNGRDTEAVCDSGSDYPIITYEKVKELGLEIDSRANDKSHENNSNYIMTEDDIKSVINEAMVKDNISRAGTVNVDLFQELCKSIKTATKSFTEQLNTIRVVSSIRRQMRSKKILISLSQLLKIVKSEVQQDIINSIANPDITKKRKIPYEGKKQCKVNKTFLNDSSFSSSSSSESGPDSEFDIEISE
ncbi:hypothetical protein Glove_131g91 [Diversispora epigaea]|uniref:Uncharacterized protein n=1 Tax=Diversispora epigaea TaxID=1348612 RepID=A0A397J784_9GLOM|nr:hypothetical protein Glove_131g91 [Diversispora epigaea]